MPALSFDVSVGIIRKKSLKECEVLDILAGEYNQNQIALGKSTSGM